MAHKTAGVAGQGSDLDEHTDQHEHSDWRGGLGGFLRLAVKRGWPYLLLLALSLVGICWANLAHTHSTLYWAMMAPLCAVVCILTAWHNSAAHHTRMRVALLQAGQWAAVMVAMWLVGVSDLRDLLNDDALGLMMLTLLALGLFVSGLNLLMWQFCLLGVFLAVAVPVIAWVEAASVLLILLAVIIVVAALVRLWFMLRLRPAV
jgi:hypothetical protein